MRAPSPTRSPPAFSAVRSLRWRATDSVCSTSEIYAALCEALAEKGYAFHTNPSNRTVTVVDPSGHAEALLWVSGRDICVRRASGDTFTFHALYRRLRGILPSVRAPGGSDAQSFRRRNRDSRESSEDAHLRSPREDSFTRKATLADFLAGLSGPAASSSMLRSGPGSLRDEGESESSPELCGLEGLEQKLGRLMMIPAGAGFRRTNRSWQGDKPLESSATPSISSSCESNLDLMEHTVAQAVEPRVLE